MTPDKFLKELSAKLAEAVTTSPAKDFEKNAKAMLSAGFAKLDLVTREEFDVQAKVLARTRERLAELETRVQALEAALAEEATRTDQAG